MSIDFPTNTVALIIAMMIGSASGSWLILSQGLRRLAIAPHVRRRWRWGAAIVLLVWLLGPLAFALNAPDGALLATPAIITLLGLGTLVGILSLLISPLFRQLLRTVPETWLVSIHATRLGGLLFLALMDMKLLPAEFALPAGYGDMAVGLLALGLVSLLAQRKPYAHALAIGWNVLGLLDFVGALTTGILFIGPFAAQVAASGVSLLYLNYVLIVPSFGVPLYTLLHVYSLFQILSARRDATKQGIGEPVQTLGSLEEQLSAHT
jgi:hypothetical protein